MNAPGLGRRALAALALAASAACAVGPDYAPPELPPPADWTSPLEGGLSAVPPDRVALARWWTTLGDPLLAELVARALVANLDLAEAQARVLEARARRKAAFAQLLPVLDAGASGGRSQSSSSIGSGDAHDSYAASLDVRWEIDLFGGLRRGLEAAEADQAASEEDLHDVLVILCGEVALSYVDLRAFQARLATAEANLAAQSESYDIARWRAQAGLTTELDVEQALTNLELTRAGIPALDAAITQAGNRLAVLTGDRPGALGAALAAPAPIPVTPLEVAVGVPAETLAQRPDVRRAERQLAAETARVGVATALQYPSLVALGSIGLEAFTPGGLFDAGAGTAQIAGSTLWTLFAGGEIDAAIEAQDAVRARALARYAQSVLLALEEVENALASYAREQDRRQALADGAAAAARAVSLAEDQYGAGLVDFQVVLVAQRSLYSLEDQLAVSEGEVTANLIRLYKALGGGWTPEG